MKAFLLLTLDSPLRGSEVRADIVSVVKVDKIVLTSGVYDLLIEVDYSDKDSLYEIENKIYKIYGVRTMMTLYACEDFDL